MQKRPILSRRPVACIYARLVGSLGSRQAQLRGSPSPSGTTVAHQRRSFLSYTRPALLSSSYRRRRLGADESVDPLSKPTTIDKASLHVVSVPIGNMKDFSFRAVDILEGVDYIVTSDRPATKALLDLIGLPSQGRLIHYSRSNQTATCAKLVELLRGGRSMALVTTSGTPCVGDVGSSLVQEMHASGVRVTAVPGPAAVTSALAVCGVAGSPFDPETTAGAEQRRREHYSSDAADEDWGNSGSTRSKCRRGLLSRRALEGMRDGSFYFGNMLPSAHGERLRLLRNTVAPAHFPCVFYEVPRRLLMTLQDIAAVLPKRRVFVCHELTKMNESLHADTAEKLVAFYMRQEVQVMLKRGEIVLVIAGAGPEEMAAWMEHEAQRRRRLRRSVSSLLAEVRDVRAAPPAHAIPSTKENAIATKKEVEKNARRFRKRERRAALLKRRRAKLIREIELAQERLRLGAEMARSGPGAM